MKIVMTCIIVIVLATRILAAENSTANLPANDFDKFFFAGGWLVWIILLPMSLITVNLIVQNFLVIRRVNLMPSDITDRLGQADHTHWAELSKVIDHNSSLLSRALFAARSAASDGIAAMETAVSDQLEQDVTRLFRKIEWLHIIGNVAPMLGLFGTVWGMINAFNAIVLAGGQPEPAQLAGGISTALVTTWWGLVVAIPALSAYGVLRNRIDSMAADIAVLIENHLHSLSKDQ